MNTLPNAMKCDFQSLNQESTLFKEISSPFKLPPFSIASHQYPSLPIGPSFFRENCPTPDLTPLVSECVRNHTVTYPSSSMRSVQLSNDNLFLLPDVKFQEFSISPEINQKSLELSTKFSDTFISPINQWIIQNALKGIDAVDDQKVEIVAILSGSSYNDIIRYLLQHGWKPSLLSTGICYVRCSGKS